MTLGGWGIYAVVVVLIVMVDIWVCSDARSNIVRVSTVVISIAVAIVVLAGMLWWFRSTEAGRREMKSQQSNFSGGIDRTVRVYDMNGGLIQEYSGKFDVDYDNDRIIFDDDSGKRHVIYYPTGTVIIDEL